MHIWPLNHLKLSRISEEDFYRAAVPLQVGAHIPSATRCKHGEESNINTNENKETHKCSTTKVLHVHLTIVARSEDHVRQSCASGM